MSKKILFVCALSISALFFVTSPGASLAQPADNTKINERDRSPNALTAGQQSETKEDREMTQNIRQAILNDKSLSTNAHNVKIITVGGMVTLKGPVKSADEKRTVEAIAGRVAGKDKLMSEIGIAP
jgi:osmotically-inducible protein OsmY